MRIDKIKNKLQIQWKENKNTHYISYNSDTNELTYYNNINYNENKINLKNYKNLGFKNTDKFEIFNDYIEHTKVCG